MKPLTLLLVLIFCVTFVQSQSSETVVVTSIKANLRGTASTSGPIVAEVVRGQKFTVVTRRGRWILVQTEAYAGWLHQSVVGAAAPRTVQPRPAEAARRAEPVEPINPNRLPLGSSPLGYGVRSGRSTLTVLNGTDTDALVRVVMIGANERLIRNFYIPANESHTAEELPPGSYVMRVAFGRDWNNSERRFNFRRSFTETEMFDVRETETSEYVPGGIRTTKRFAKISITLHKVKDGNFTTKQISEDDFWGVDQ